MLFAPPLFLSIYRVLIRLCAIYVAASVVTSSSAYAKTINQISVVDDSALVAVLLHPSGSHSATLTNALLELYPHFTDEDIAGLVGELEQHITESNQPFFSHQPLLDDGYEVAISGTTAGGIEWKLTINLVIIILE